MSILTHISYCWVWKCKSIFSCWSEQCRGGETSVAVQQWLCPFWNEESSDENIFFMCWQVGASL